MLHLHCLKHHKPLATDDAIAGFDVYRNDRAVLRRKKLGRVAVLLRPGYFQRCFTHRRDETIEREMEHLVLPGEARGLLDAAFGETDGAVMALRDRNLDHMIA